MEEKRVCTCSSHQQKHPGRRMTCLIFAEYLPAGEEAVDSVMDTDTKQASLPSAVCSRSFRQPWVKLRAEPTALGLHLVPCLSRCPDKWVIEKTEWAWIQLKHMLPFLLWLRILITGGKKRVLSVSSALTVMKRLLSLSLNPSTSWPGTELLSRPLSPQPRGGPGSQGYHLPLKDFSSQRPHCLCTNWGSPQIQRPLVEKNNFSGNQQMFA